MRLKKLNTGIVTQIPPKGGRIQVNTTEEKYLKYQDTFKPFNHSRNEKYKA